MCLDIVAVRHDCAEVGLPETSGRVPSEVCFLFLSSRVAKTATIWDVRCHPSVYCRSFFLFFGSRSRALRDVIPRGMVGRPSGRNPTWDGRATIGTQSHLRWSGGHRDAIPPGMVGRLSGRNPTWDCRAAVGTQSHVGWSGDHRDAIPPEIVRRPHLGWSGGYSVVVSRPSRFQDVVSLHNRAGKLGLG